MATISLCSELLKERLHSQLIFPELAKEIGLEEDIVLQQIHYWLQKSGKFIENTLWIYNTFEDWRKQFSYWSLSKIKRIFYSLERKGFIKSKKMNVKKSNHTKWYSINYDKLNNLIAKLGSISKKVEKSHLNKISDVTAKEQKKFASVHNELSSFQIDTIIIGNTNNNYTNTNFLYGNKEIECIKNQPEEKVTKKRKTTFSDSGVGICQDMLKVWYSVFIKNKKEIFLTNRRTHKLLDIWNQIVNQDIEQWRNFCISINSSKFLMGEKKSDFKAYFDWLIDKETVRKILASEFGVGDRIPDLEQETLKLNKLETAKKIKLQEAELTKQKMEEERKLQIERLALKLAKEELTKLEENWTEEDLLNAKSQFEVYIKQESENKQSLGYIKKLFDDCGWNAPFIDHFFDEFKIKHFLNLTFDWFLEKAKGSIAAK